jgi:hypothetical protein
MILLDNQTCEQRTKIVRKILHFWQLKRRKEACGLLRIIAAAVVELGGARLTVPGARCTSSSVAPFSSAVVMKVARIECTE